MLFTHECCDLALRQAEFLVVLPLPFNRDAFLERHLLTY